MDTRYGYDDPQYVSEYTEATELAKLAVEQVGPHNYKIVGREDKPLRFLITGCHGTGDENQKQVADLMEHIAERPDEIPIDFILFLGDNGYDFGFNSPDHPGFDRCFNNIYGNNKFSFINKMICLMGIGNHDENYHAKYKLSRNPQGAATGINQAARTYLNHTEAKVNLFSQEEIDIRDLQGYANNGDQWVMPFFYEGYDLGPIQLFCINSNEIAKKYLEFITSETNHHGIGDRNQFQWLKAEYDKAHSEGKKIIIAAHHPVYTCGKRAFPDKFDSTHYLTTNEIERLKDILEIKTSSYQSILLAILKKSGMNDLFFYFCAHDHFLSYFDNADDPNSTIKLRQFTAGGGGGPLQPRMTCDEHPWTFYLKNHGAGLFTYDPKNPNGYVMDIFTKGEEKEGMHFRFNEANHHAPVFSANLETRIELLAYSVLSACDKYLTSLRDEETELQRKSQGNKEFSNSWVGLASWSLFQAKEYVMPDKIKKIRTEKILIIDKIRALFSQFTLTHFDDLVLRLYQLTQQIGKVDNHQFFQSLEKEILETMEIKLDNLFHNAKREAEGTPFYFKKSPTV